MSKVAQLDGQGRLILGPRFEAPTAAKIQVKPEVDDSVGVVLDARPSAVGSNERVGIRLGDWWLMQDSAANGTKDIALLDESGDKVATLAEASELTTPYTRRVTLYKSTIPLVVLPSGSVANDGALTSGTARTQNVAVGAYCWFPAAALWVQDLVGPPIVPTSSPAGWYYVVFSGADVGTIYKNTWDGASSPAAPATLTPIVSTADGAGPGAFTGPTAEAEYISLPIPASLVGDLLQVSIDAQTTDNVNVKTLSLGINTSSLQDFALASLGNVALESRITEVEADVQGFAGTLLGDAAALVHAPSLEGETTSAAWTLGIFVTKANATDVVEILNFTVERDR